MLAWSCSWLLVEIEDRDDGSCDCDTDAECECGRENREDAEENVHFRCSVDR